MGRKNKGTQSQTRQIKEQTKQARQQELLLPLSRSPHLKQRKKNTKNKNENLSLAVGFRVIVPHIPQNRHLATRSTISFLNFSSRQLYQYGCRPPGFPTSLLLASSAAWGSQLFTASPLCHLVMKRPATSTTLRYHFQPFLVALGHSTVSTSNSKGELSVDPSVAWNTLMSSARHWV